MRKEMVLITGANGEIGHGLITHLGEKAEIGIVAIDVQPLDESLTTLSVSASFRGISSIICCWVGLSPSLTFALSTTWHRFSRPKLSTTLKLLTG